MLYGLCDVHDDRMGVGRLCLVVLLAVLLVVLLAVLLAVLLDWVHSLDSRGQGDWVDSVDCLLDHLRLGSDNSECQRFDNSNSK